jgi:hypothetical protein
MFRFTARALAHPSVNVQAIGIDKGQSRIAVVQADHDGFGIGLEPDNDPGLSPKTLDGLNLEIRHCFVSPLQV